MTRGLDQPWRAGAELPDALGRRWAAEWRGWFDPARPPAACAGDLADLARLETPLGWVMVKRERPTGWKRPVEELRLRSSRAERAFERALELAARGLETPTPLAVLGTPGDAALVTRFVAGQGLWEWRRALPDSGPLLELLAEGLARLHAAGFRHRDLKASNLLVVPGSDARPARLVWTDLDGLRALGTVEPRVRARDLARLEASFCSAEARAAGVRAGDWPTLVRLYLTAATGRAPEPDALARFLRRTHEHCQRVLRRHLARGRAVS